VSGQRLDELFGLGGGQVLSNLEALHQIELPAEVDRRSEIGSMKVAGIDQELTSVDVGSIDPGHRCACPAPKIHDAADRDGSRQLGMIRCADRSVKDARKR